MKRWCGIRHVRWAWGCWRRHRAIITIAPGSVWMGEAEDRRLAAVLRGDA